MVNNHKIIHALIFMSILFLGLILYLSYFELFTREQIITNPYNRRLLASEEKVIRGKIYDRNKVILAKSEMNGSKQVRKYPFASLYSHVIGYSSAVYGKSLLEAQYNDYLLGKNDFSAVFEFKNKIAGKSLAGNDLYLTLDNGLQQKAIELLDERKGAVIAINPKTGELLAMVSKPDYDPNEGPLNQNWKQLAYSKDHTLLARANLGLYAPGSTYKVLICAAALEKGLGNQTYDDNGNITIDGKNISNYGGEVHGKLSLREALSVSSNAVFSQLGVNLGENTLREIALRAGFNTDISFDIPISRSLFPYKNMSKADMAVSAIGQGKVLVSPLHMALLASSIANKGAMMKPILVDKIQNNDNVVIKSQKPSVNAQVMSAELATQVTDMMIDVVNNGTGKNAQIKGVKVAGKTGTAENELSTKDKNNDHAWFIGFAPAYDPKIAVAVILEYSGSTGGDTAAPIAQEIINSWLNTPR